MAVRRCRFSPPFFSRCLLRGSIRRTRPWLLRSRSYSCGTASFTFSTANAFSSRFSAEVVGIIVAPSQGMTALRFQLVAGVLAGAALLSPCRAQDGTGLAAAIKPGAARHSAGPTWSAIDGPEALASRLSEAVNGRTKSGQWGAVVVSLTKGDTLFAQNADSPMAPASTMKMYTSSMALDRFGPDFVFRTPVLRDGTLSADGTLSGNLYLRGVGGPSLSSRFWKGDSPMDALARQIARTGLKQVHGDVVGDASAFDSQTIPDGWKKSYLGAAYAARVSALSLNENLVWIVVQPNGRTASVSLEPATTTIPVRPF